MATTARGEEREDDMIADFPASCVRSHLLYDPCTLVSTTDRIDINWQVAGGNVVI
jgi:hypothetical protein